MVKSVTLFVEGGGDQNELGAKCRKGFRSFLEKAGLKGNMPRILPCGSRNSAFERYREAVLKGQKAVLLVDSEAPVHVNCEQGTPQDWLPWSHLKYGSGDGWNKPRGESEEDCHLMVECMECWILADRKTIISYFGKGFRESALPSDKKPPESVGKTEVLAGLKMATRDCAQKGTYRKGKRSYELLVEIDVAKVVVTCPWAARFVNSLEKKMSE